MVCNCKNCEFAMTNGKELVCAGRTKEYGMPIEKTLELYPNGCDCWEEEIRSFIRRTSQK